MPNTYRIQVLTKETVPGIGAYSDAQYFEIPSTMTVDEFRATHEAEIEDEKARRIANWVDAIRNPAPQVEPTREQLQAERAELQQRIAELDVRISERTR